MPAKLTLYPTQGASRTFVFREGNDHRIGRDPLVSDVVVDDPRVSARHALVRWDRPGWSLVDLGSKNGTFVEGYRSSEARVSADSWLSFGGLLARFEEIPEGEFQRVASERPARLQTLARATEELGERLEPRTLLRRLIRSVLDLTGAERGFVLLLDASGELHSEVAAGFAASEPVDDRFAGSVGAIERVLRTGERVVSANALSDAFLGARPSVVEMGIEALACVPLFGDEKRVIGLIYVDGRVKGGVFTELDLEILEALAEHASLVAGGLHLERQIRELVGAPATVDARDVSFFDELERRIGLARMPGSAPDEISPS